MAIIIGTSQAWSQIIDILASRNLIINKVENIQILLTQKRRDCEKAKEDATKKFEGDLEKAIVDIDQAKVDFQKAIDASRKASDAQIEMIENAIQILQKERGFIRRFINKPKIRGYKEQIRQVKNQHNKYYLNLEADVTKKLKNIEFKKSHRNTLIENEYKTITGDILCLEQALRSPFLYGAIAELELIEILQNLPANFYVINNVKLNLRKGLRFDGEWLQSAQIDHLVISPAGIFVIEAKNWSKEFIEHGDYFDPYQQVKRSSYLCYKFLENELHGTKVRSIIAYKGNIPPKPDDSFVKVLQFREVNSYILWFKENKLNNEQIRDLAEYLR